MMCNKTKCDKCFSASHCQEKRFNEQLKAQAEIIEKYEKSLDQASKEITYLTEYQDKLLDYIASIREKLNLVEYDNGTIGCPEYATEVALQVIENMKNCDNCEFNTPETGDGICEQCCGLDIRQAKDMWMPKTRKHK